MKKNILRWPVVISLFALTASIFALWSIFGVQQEIKNIDTTPKLSADLAVEISQESKEEEVSVTDQVFLVDEQHPVVFPEGMPIPIQISNIPGGPATTTQFVARAGAQDTSNVAPSDVITVYSGDVLLYSNSTLGFYFGLPSEGKTLRIDDTGTYARKDNAILWLWFKKNYDVGVANFFITPTTANTFGDLSFDYNFKGYPKYTAMLSSATTTVGALSALEVTVSYESASPGYPNTWKFVHIIHDEHLYTFGAQIEPLQTGDYQYTEKLISVFKNTFNFVD